ncbi:SWI/SNF complex subunit SMARCC2 [Papilio machaon]|uniref:SWI/SNF complex subunit SMARCC2 n=1 Tax=Papilio machaon TaxID=76193 RepID=A0A0N1PIV8_PAPMA|nr:SWI/SNF complex subunit SMARCC2 [Papilio machaon]
MASLGPKKDGGPNVEFFQAPESLAQFDQIRVWLQKNCKKHVQTDPPTKEGLAQLVIQLIQYQENKLGKNASDPPFLRLPVSSIILSIDITLGSMVLGKMKNFSAIY